MRRHTISPVNHRRIVVELAMSPSGSMPTNAHRLCTFEHGVVNCLLLRLIRRFDGLVFE